MAIFHALNFSIFMVIFVCYSYLYYTYTSRTVMKTSGTNSAQDQDIALAKRLIIVVATDFLCWIPINLMGM